MLGVARDVDPNCVEGPRLANRLLYCSGGALVVVGPALMFKRFELESEVGNWLTAGRVGISLSAGVAFADFPRRRSPALFILRISRSPASSARPAVPDRDARGSGVGFELDLVRVCSKWARLGVVRVRVRGLLWGRGGGLEVRGRGEVVDLERNGTRSGVIV